MAKTPPPRDTREALLRAATRLYAAHGFEGTSVREIADAAKVNLAMVSYHFGSKEGLYSACVEQYGSAELESARRHLLTPPTSPEEIPARLEAFCLEIIETHLAQPEVAQIIYRECDVGIPITEKIFRKTFVATIQTLVGFFEAAGKRGWIRRGLDPLSVSGLLFGSIHHALRMRSIAVKLMGHDLAIAEVRQQMIRQWLDITLNGALVTLPTEKKPMKRTKKSQNARRKLPKLLLLFCLGVASSLSPGAAQASELSLQQYLSEVRSGNQGYAAARSASEGALLRSRESALIFSPQFTATGQIYSDARPQLTAFAPVKTDASGFQFGVAQQFPFGMQARLGYQLTHTKIDVANPMIFNTTDYYDAIPSLELSVPLLRNFGAREATTTRTLAEASALATHYGEGFRSRGVLLEAELSYWRLAVAREVVGVASKTLERTRYLQDWAEKRTKLNLGDRSDWLQASAAVHFRDLELKNARDEERAATQNFNSVRGEVATASVPELFGLARASLDIPAEWKSLDAPPRAREDLLAQEQAQRLTRTQAEQVGERNRPNLELFGQASLNGRAIDLSGAISSGWSMDKRTAAVGVRLVSTLNFGAKSDAQAGAEKERDAATTTYERKKFEQRQEFLDLRSKLAEAQGRLALARELEKIQNDKLENERLRLQRGRSTTFQLIQFESDDSTAQLNRIRTQFEVIRLVAQLNLFSAPEEGVSP